MGLLISIRIQDHLFEATTCRGYHTVRFTRELSYDEDYRDNPNTPASTTPFWHATCPSTESKRKKTKSLGGKEEEEEEEEEEEKERAIEKVNLKAVLGGRWLVGAGCDEVCINKQKLSCCCLG
ncbi:hypothetical protein V1477_014458 [Vespula maculifrons]|uniref:Uncharacterized protein n=1 Tax=Vespula maculifrons TaxID=7453 RepID=A0ABD2BL31_VESMC